MGSEPQGQPALAGREQAIAEAIVALLRPRLDELMARLEEMHRVLEMIGAKVDTIYAQLAAMPGADQDGISS
jgi:hypothetical protein